MVKSLHYREGRNVYDLRFLRLDNYLSPNGRDVYVPHCVQRSSFLPTTASLKMNCQEQLSVKEAVPQFNIVIDEEEEEENSTPSKSNSLKKKMKNKEESKPNNVHCSVDKRINFIFAPCGGEIITNE